MEMVIKEVTGCDFPEIHSDLPVKTPILRLEAFLKALPADQQSHYETMVEFFEGGKAQAIFIPAGQILVGKTHLKEHLVIMLGDISVQDEKGVITRMQGFRMFTSPAGVKRAGVTHADTIFINVHCGQWTGQQQFEEECIQDDLPPNTHEVLL